MRFHSLFVCSWGLLITAAMISGCASVKSQFESAETQGSINAYEQFLEDNPTGPYSDTARRKLERLRFEDAIKSENEGTLKKLLSTVAFPDADYVKEGKEVLAKFSAKRLLENESLEGYNLFYKDYDGTDQAKSLENSFDEYYGKYALSKDSLDIYDGYITRFPNGKHANEAREKGEAIWWKEKSSTTSVKDLKQYVNLFPNGSHLSQVKEVLEKRMWKTAEQDGKDADLYLSYIEQFPEGPHNGEARDCVDWSIAERKGPKGIKTYLDLHPSGRFVSHGEQIIKSADQVDENMKNTIESAVWSQFKNSMGRHYGGGTMTVYGSITGDGIKLSYHGVVDKNGKASLLINNYSTYKINETVYEYYDGDWYPKYDRIFNEN